MERILAVEDDEALALGIEYALKKEDFYVTLAKTIREAEDSFNTGEYDLILLDVMLPDGSGYDLCRHIRKKSDVPIIFLTACDEEVNVVLGLDIGGDDYIAKPFRVKELISRIKAILRRTSGAGDREDERPALVSNDITVYPLETKVMKKNEELQLTPVEYRLLAVFIQNPLQTLTRERILEKLWDVEGEFVDDNTLSVYIRRLREKLEDDPSNPQYIITVRGMGYKWNRRRS